VLASNRDVHVNVPKFRVGTEGVQLYAPAIAVAIASLASSRLPQPHVAILGHVDIGDNFIGSVVAVTQPSHVLSLLTQGFRQLMVAEREAVANDMVDLLGDSGIELWVDEDPMATFSSTLFNVFGLPAPAEPSEEQEADETVREQEMQCMSDVSSPDSQCTCVSYYTPGGGCRGRRPGGGGRGGVARSGTYVALIVTVSGLRTPGVPVEWIYRC
jgi:hypothetical protein